MRLNFNKKLLFCIIAMVTAMLCISGSYSYIISKNTLRSLGKQFIASMITELEDTIGLQNSITQEKLDTDLLVFEKTISEQGNLFLSSNSTFSETITNQTSGEKESARIPHLMIGSPRYSEPINNTSTIVDNVQKIVGGTATIFQVLPGKLLRISTNVLKKDGSRASGTYIPDLNRAEGAH